MGCRNGAHHESPEERLVELARATRYLRPGRKITCDGRRGGDMEGDLAAQMAQALADADGKDRRARSVSRAADANCRSR